MISAYTTLWHSLQTTVEVLFCVKVWFLFFFHIFCLINREPLYFGRCDACDPENPSFKIRQQVRVKASVHWVGVDHIHKHIKKWHSNNSWRQSSQAWQRGVSQRVEWAGGYHPFKLEEKSTRQDWAEPIPDLMMKQWTITGAKMNFQQEEQEFDFSYLFEDGQSVKDEAERGEHWRQIVRILFSITKILILRNQQVKWLK